jgi:hypothetical protein
MTQEVQDSFTSAAPYNAKIVVGSQVWPLAAASMQSATAVPLTALPNIKNVPCRDGCASARQQQQHNATRLRCWNATITQCTMHLCYAFVLVHSHYSGSVFSMARCRLGSHGSRVDRGRREVGQHISHEDRTCRRCISSSLVDDEYHAHSVCLLLLVLAKISLK